MSWKSDWLYCLIFKEFEKAWLKAIHLSDSALPVDTFNLFLTEHNTPDFNDEAKKFGRKRVRSWLLTQNGWVETSPTEYVATYEMIGNLYRWGFARFHICEDRKKVALEYVFGPLYGRSFEMIVSGQGKTGELYHNPNASERIS